MRARVIKAMEDLDYSPSAAAMNFAAGRTGVIAVIANNLDGEWISPLLRGIEKTLMQDRRASLLLGSLTHDGRYDAKVVRSWIEERRVDGAIFLRPRKSERPLLRMVRKHGVAYSVVAADIPSRGGFDIRSDNILGGRLLAEHLLDLGHRRFAYIGGERSSRDSEDRLAGAQAHLEKHDSGISPRNIIEGSFDAQDGRDYAKRWLKMKPSSRPTAVMFGDDTMALGFVGSLLQAGVNVPRDVSVTGFNDIPASGWIWPGLTTIRQQLVKLGESACDQVLQGIAAGSPPDKSPTTTFAVELIARQTTGPAPRRSASRQRR
jgi:LacI family transcriptional regulator